MPVRKKLSVHLHTVFHCDVTSRSIDWLIDWLIDYPSIDWLIGSLIDWLIGPFIDWLIGPLIDWLIDWLIDGLIGSLIDWLIERLIDWLIRSLVFDFILTFRPPVRKITALSELRSAETKHSVFFIIVTGDQSSGGALRTEYGDIAEKLMTLTYFYETNSKLASGVKHDWSAIKILWLWVFSIVVFWLFAERSPERLDHCGRLQGQQIFHVRRSWWDPFDGMDWTGEDAVVPEDHRRQFLPAGGTEKTHCHGCWWD